MYNQSGQHFIIINTLTILYFKLICKIIIINNKILTIKIKNNYQVERIYNIWNNNHR